MSVFVNALNDPPIATDDTVTAAEDTALSIPVLLNDTDVDDDGLTITSIGTPVHGSAVVDGAGITYTPAANFTGVDAFTYTIGDGHGGSSMATVVVTVTNGNDPPVAVNDAATTSEDTSVDIAVVANDTDPDALDVLSVTSVGVPAHGTAVIKGSGAVTYTPAPNYSGPDSFTYTIGDGHGGAATATVNVTITRAERRAGGGERQRRRPPRTRRSSSRSWQTIRMPTATP